MRFHLPAAGVALARLLLFAAAVWFGWWGMMASHLMLVAAALCLAAMPAVQVKPRRRRRL